MGTGIYEILAYKILNSIVMVIIKMRNKQMLNMAIACKMTVNNLMVSRQFSLVGCPPSKLAIF